MHQVSTRILLTLSACCLALLTSCTFLPEDGPSTGAILSGASSAKAQIEQRGEGYQLTELTAAIAQRLDDQATGKQLTGFDPYASLPRPQQVGMIGIGDGLNVTLWEPNPTGQTLFTIPGYAINVRVSPTGDIALPYAATIHAAGMTEDALGRAIVGTYRAQGHQVQVSVYDETSVSNAAVVQGDVVRPGTYPLVPNQDTLLDLIADAGGPNSPSGFVQVRVTRQDGSASAPIWDVDRDQMLNITISPGDQVMLIPHPKYVFGFGAINRPSLIELQKPRETLIELLSQMAGLSDALAAPRGVFIYRTGMGPKEVQTIFRLNMTEPASFFIANNFFMQPGDIVYISDAPMADVTKVLNAIQGASNTAGIGRNFGANY